IFFTICCLKTSEYGTACLPVLAPWAVSPQRVSRGDIFPDTGGQRPIESGTQRLFNVRSALGVIRINEGMPSADLDLTVAARIREGHRALDQRATQWKWNEKDAAQRETVALACELQALAEITVDVRPVDEEGLDVAQLQELNELDDAVREQGVANIRLEFLPSFHSRLGREVEVDRLSALKTSPRSRRKRAELAEELGGPEGLMKVVGKLEFDLVQMV
ncbi:hypothetical protein, partial [Pyxidicoccus trucidator]|uniref:hypothetical protein n=1 Tax=Pyxidicoccus trucidator TaxID=2709662 RepID=UPI0019679115